MPGRTGRLCVYYTAARGKNTSGRGRFGPFRACFFAAGQESARAGGAGALPQIRPPGAGAQRRAFTRRRARRARAAVPTRCGLRGRRALASLGQHEPGAGQHDVLGHVAFGLDGAFQLAVRSVDKYLLLAVCIYQTSSGFKFAEHAPFLHEFQPGEVYLSQQLAVVGAQLQNGQALALAEAFEPDTLFGSGDLLYFGLAVKLK